MPSTHFNDKPLKLVLYFTYLGNYISSIKRHINIPIGKAMTVIRSMEIQSKIKLELVQGVAVFVLLYG